MHWLAISLISLVISVPLSALMLMFSTKIFKLSDVSYKTALKILLILGVTAFLLDTFIFILLPNHTTLLGALQFIIVNIILAIILIQKVYNVTWQQTFKVWGVWFLLGLGVMLIVAFIIGIINVLFIPIKIGV